MLPPSGPILVQSARLGVAQQRQTRFKISKKNNMEVAYDLLDRAVPKKTSNGLYLALAIFLTIPSKFNYDKWF